MNALLTLLNLNNATDGISNPLTNLAKASGKIPVPQGPPVWKVLILDQYTKDVLATVLRVQDLRDVGVTLHVCVRELFLYEIRIDCPAASCTPLDLRYRTYLRSTSSHQIWLTSSE